MGLFGFIKKGVKAVTGITRHLPGPIGTVSGIAHRGLKGRGPRSPRPPQRFPQTFTRPAPTGGGVFGGDPYGTGRTDLQRMADMGALVFGGVPSKVGAVRNLAGDASRLLGPAFQGGASVSVPSAGGSLATLQNVPIITQPQVRQIQKAPPGYVLVTRNGVTAAVLKPVARQMGLWKPRKKPPISVSEYTALQKANRAETKIKRLAQKADFVVRKSKR